MAKVTKGRIIIPQNVEEGLQLAQKVYEKHTQDGASSLLNNIEGYSWAEVGGKIETCLKKHLEAEELKRKMEEAYRERDLIAPEVMTILRASASLLKAVYSKNPKKLGEWGFSVDDTPKVKEKKAKE
jgi:hypothetical protein